MATEPPPLPPLTPVASAAAGPAPAVKSLACPNCGGAIEVRAAGYTVTLICVYCSSVLDVADPDVRIIARYNEESQRLAIPLGTLKTQVLAAKQKLKTAMMEKAS